jgi:ribosomal protein L37AE/L43A
MTTTEWGNCSECKQGRPKRVLDSDGVCPRCKTTVITAADNPALENTQHINVGTEVR